MEHGKIEENTVNSGIFNGWGDKGIGSIVEHDVFDRFYGDKSVKYRALKETIAKTWKHIQRTKVSWLFLHQVQQGINPKGVVALLTSSATRYKP